MLIILHELVRLCSVVYAEPLAVRGQVGCCTLQLGNSTVEVEPRGQVPSLGQ